MPTITLNQKEIEEVLKEYFNITKLEWLIKKKEIFIQFQKDAGKIKNDNSLGLERPVLKEKPNKVQNDIMTTGERTMRGMF